TQWSQRAKGRKRVRATMIQYPLELFIGQRVRTQHQVALSAQVDRCENRDKAQFVWGRSLELFDRTLRLVPAKLNTGLDNGNQNKVDDGVFGIAAGHLVRNRLRFVSVAGHRQCQSGAQLRIVTRIIRQYASRTLKRSGCVSI